MTDSYGIELCRPSRELPAYFDLRQAVEKAVKVFGAQGSRCLTEYLIACVEHEVEPAI